MRPRAQGMPSTQGLIVRLPKYQDDPAWEAMPVPEALTIEYFRAAPRLWRWQRRMAGRPEGDQPPSRSGIHPTGSVGTPRAPRRIG
jgi:hypothetical protein